MLTGCMHTACTTEQRQQSTAEGIAGVERSLRHTSTSQCIALLLARWTALPSQPCGAALLKIHEARWEPR